MAVFFGRLEYACRFGIPSSLGEARKTSSVFDGGRPGPAYRWNEIILDEMQTSFVTLPLAARHLALYHAALDDAAAVVSHYRKDNKRSDDELDAAVKSTRQPSVTALSPSIHAAVAAAAADVLGYLFPKRAAFFQKKAEEAIQTRVIAGVDYPLRWPRAV